MRKIRLLILLVTFSFLFVACSKDDDAFEEQLDTYITHWHESEFTEMYEMTSTETHETYDPDAYIKRYEKIYDDLGIKNLEVTTEEIPDDMLEQGVEEKVLHFPTHIKMDSIAGPIEFDTEIPLKKETDSDDKSEWVIDWNPGLIFPQLSDGGKIGIEHIQAERGEILDRNQMPLAINSSAYEIGVIPGDLLDANIPELAKILKIPEDQINDALSADWVQPDQFVPLKTLPESEQNLIDQALTLTGVSQREVSGRVYPADKAAAHLIGYIGKATAEDVEKANGAYDADTLIGKRGAEQLYEEELRGTPGVKIVVKQENQEDTLAEVPVKNGENIKLTIDVNLQESVYDSYDDDAGTATVINPKSGEALALVSSPSFDPNTFAYGISQKELNKLENDPKKPLLNRFSATFAPGSVQKPITAAIGLQEGTLKPDDGLTIKGLTWSNGKGWGDYKVKRVSTSEKPVDLKDAMIRSDNIYFAKQIVNMGHSEFEKGLKNFGFAEDIPFAYPIKKSQISNSGDLKSEVLLANTSYGQGEIEMSALHLAIGYTPLFNEGDLLQPKLLVDDKKEVWHADLLEKDQIKILKESLREVVTNKRGTAHVIDSNKIDISGKTGTAELKSSQDDKKPKENSWFVAYPSEKENLLIAIMVEDTKGRGPITIEKATDIINKWNK